MSIKRTLILLTLLVITGVLTCGWLLQNERDKFEMAIISLGDSSNSPTSLQMYNIIENKSKEYDIPKHILYNIAYLETRYCGPFDWSYNPYQTSCAGAQGPMQIITRFAHKHAGRTVSEKELRTNLELNINVSCHMLKELYKTYGRWDIVLGYYNTGYPQVNGYAQYGSSNKDYKNKWIKPNF
jgi:soluble lytic murein transglycosylase-like protein